MTDETLSVPGGGDAVVPKPTIGFFLGNMGKLLKMRRATRAGAESQVAAVEKQDQPIIPDFEGTGGPMEEGMIYLLFNAQEGIGPMDSSFRIFWVNAPSLRFSFFDSFLVSESLKSGQWDRSFQRGIFEARAKDRFHQEVHLTDFDMVCDGCWAEGYDFHFDDRLHQISGDVRFEPFDEGVLTYFNGRTAVSPAMLQRFYDIFAMRACGDLQLQGSPLILKEGRAIIEHGLGIFSNYDIEDWRWLNLGLSNGGVVHLFYYSLHFGEAGIFAAGEGAAVVEGDWHHFRAGDFTIEEETYAPDPNLTTEIPVAWHVTAGRDIDGQPLLDLQIRRRESISWVGAMGKDNEFISNYVLEAEGTWLGQPITAKGTLENQMHRIIS